MAVEKKGSKWVARVYWCGERITVGNFGTEGAARIAHDSALSELHAGTSILWRAGTASYQHFADSIGVRHGTLKRWVGEGLPVEREGLASPRVKIEEARAWLKEHHVKSVAFNRTSVVYVAERDDGLVKIGFTSDLARRTKELCKESGGVPVSIIAALPGDKPKELRLHALFEAQRIEGEWYNVDAANVVKALAGAA